MFSPRIHTQMLQQMIVNKLTVFISTRMRSEEEEANKDYMYNIYTIFRMNALLSIELMYAVFPHIYLQKINQVLALIPLFPCSPFITVPFITLYYYLYL